MLKNTQKKKIQKKKQKKTLFPLVPHPHPQRNTDNSSGVQSNKMWPSFNADQSKQSERANRLLSRAALKICVWCRINFHLAYAPEVTLPHVSSLALHTSNVHFSKEKS